MALRIVHERTALPGLLILIFSHLLRKSCMALLPILRYPDPRLHKIAKPVTTFDERLKQLVANMADTMYDAPGVGLAATQVDVHERVIVIDLSLIHI